MTADEAEQPENILKLFEMITGRKATPDEKAQLVLQVIAGQQGREARH